MNVLGLPMPGAPCRAYAPLACARNDIIPSGAFLTSSIISVPNGNTTLGKLEFCINLRLTENHNGVGLRKLK